MERSEREAAWFDYAYGLGVRAGVNSALAKDGDEGEVTRQFADGLITEALKVINGQQGGDCGK